MSIKQLNEADKRWIKKIQHPYNRSYVFMAFIAFSIIGFQFYLFIHKDSLVRFYSIIINTIFIFLLINFVHYIRRFVSILNKLLKSDEKK